MRGRVARGRSGGQGRWCDETESAREAERESCTETEVRRTVSTFIQRERVNPANIELKPRKINDKGITFCAYKKSSLGGCAESMSLVMLWRSMGSPIQWGGFVPALSEPIHMVVRVLKSERYLLRRV